MEYASSSWDPYKPEDADYLDKVQRRAARYACNSYTERTQECVTAMVNALGWETLQGQPFPNRWPQGINKQTCMEA